MTVFFQESTINTSFLLFRFHVFITYTGVLLAYATGHNLYASTIINIFSAEAASVTTATAAATTSVLATGGIGTASGAADGNETHAHFRVCMR